VNWPCARNPRFPRKPLATDLEFVVAKSANVRLSTERVDLSHPRVNIPSRVTSIRKLSSRHPFLETMIHS
jgi:hypothetical protein